MRALRTSFVLLTLAACGRVDIQRLDLVDAAQRDAGIDAGTDGGVDAGTDGGTDAGPRIFGSPSSIAELNSPSSESDPSLTEDELEIFFLSDRSGDQEIWRARRASRTDPWGDIEVVAEVSDPSVETDPEVSADGLHLFFSSFRGGNNDIWETTRAMRTSPWSAPIAVAELSSTDQECCASISGDTLRLVLASDRGPGSDANLFAASRGSSSSAWNAPVGVIELNTTSEDSNPHLSPDELSLLFDSDRPDAIGGRDIFVATRISIADPFGAQIAIAELASAADERDPWLSSDGRRIWFTSDRDGDYDVFVAER